MPDSQLRYPIYIPTKGRFDDRLRYTIRYLERDEVPFRAVVLAEEYDDYARVVKDEKCLLVRDCSPDLISTRNFIFEHAIAEGYERHHQLDDNIDGFRRLWKQRRIPCHSGVALRCIEEFTDRYENIAVSGPNYQMFVTPATTRVPFYLNVHVYSCMLINNAIPYRFRGPRNEDTDMSLQVLAGGWCTVLINVYCATKKPTLLLEGGMASEYAQKEDGFDGRLAMARDLERAWPGVVKVDRRWGRPQHVIDWRKFKGQLKRREDVDFESMPKVDELGVRMRAVSEVKHPWLRRKLEDQGLGHLLTDETTAVAELPRTRTTPTVAILCGGRGLRLGELTHSIPKPLIEIAGQPILKHLIDIYVRQGHKRFVLLSGYLSEKVEEFVERYPLWSNGVEITVVPSPPDVQTGARLKSAATHLGDQFFLSYGDVLANVNLAKLRDYHQKHDGLATMTVIRPALAFGVAEIDSSQKVRTFREKPPSREWANGGFFLFDRAALDYFGDADDLILEREPLEGLARDGKLRAFYHDGFWDCADTAKDVERLEGLFASGHLAPWAR